MRAADKTDGHHVDTLSTFIYKGPVESRQNEEAEAVESANALRPKNRVVLIERLLAEMGWLSLIDGIEIGIRKEHKLDKYRRKVITNRLYSKGLKG